MTYNNLCVLHKQQKKLEQATTYIKKVIAEEEKMLPGKRKWMDLSQSFINLCSVYSEMGKHEIALNYIERAA